MTGPGRLLHVVLPGDVDDPSAPSGGNAYDRQVCRGLAATRSVRELPVAGGWPRPAAAALTELAAVLDAVPDDGLVLLDGLVACAAPAVLVPRAARLRLVVLVHLPLADETGLAPADAAVLHAGERRVLHAADAVVATSRWAARRLVERHGLPDHRVHVATPGTQPAALAPGTAGGCALTCVAAVTPRKGHDLLVGALAVVAGLPWRCVCAGALDSAGGHVDRLHASVAAAGLTGRVAFVGPRCGADLEAVYAATDLLVLPSRAETFGMVVTEALARGIPVLATAVGGVPEALGHAPDGSRPGLLVEPDDPAALAAALRRWLTDPDTRHRLRRSARDRRATLPGWDHTVRALSDILQRERR